MNNLPSDHKVRVRRAKLSLDGLRIGDSFGECFFDLGAGTHVVLMNRVVPRPLWSFTDDTVMSLSIVEVLELFGYINQDRLAEGFSAKYRAQPGRGYGPGAHQILIDIGKGRNWRTVSRQAFRGHGSLGNGGAMRAAPIGGYFADDPEHAAVQAVLAAEITHSHKEGQAGAAAVAAAAAVAGSASSSQELLEIAIEYTAESATRDGLYAALELPVQAPVVEAAEELGNGSKISAPDTVPYAIWCASRHLGDFEEAMWETVSRLGDCDTTCAIVGGIVSLSLEGEKLPSGWLDSTEPYESLSRVGLHRVT